MVLLDQMADGHYGLSAVERSVQLRVFACWGSQWRL